MKEKNLVNNWRSATPLEIQPTANDTKSRDICSLSENDQILRMQDADHSLLFWRSVFALSPFLVSFALPTLSESLHLPLLISIAGNLGLPRAIGERVKTCPVVGGQHSLHSDTVSSPSCRNSSRSSGAVRLRHCIRFTLLQSVKEVLGYQHSLY